ncbi:hypothetical protein AN958_09470, partial [Leucoagaricus sp. SymC.cos]
LLFFNSTTSASLPATNSFWGKLKPKNKEGDLRQQATTMAMTRQRLLTLVCGEQETLHLVGACFRAPSPSELEDMARNWTKPPPDVPFHLRVPVEYASLHAAELDIMYPILTGEDSYQIAIMGVQGLRVEIVTDAPPPPDEPPPPPPQPVLDMPATFSLELTPGQNVALEVSVVSDELDMARMDDGTVVDGQFWGKLNIVHQGDNHKLDFQGTRLPQGPEFTTEVMFDSRTIGKLAIASRPPVARCQLSVICPSAQYCDLMLQTSSFWRLSMTWPPAEPMDGDPNKVKFFCRSHPGGALEHFDSETVTTALYYEAIPDASMIDPNSFIAPRNGFAMPFRDFLLHLKNVLDQLGLSIHARTNFINNNIAAWSLHKNIAYRFLSPAKIAAAIDITVAADPCNFATAGEKEANVYNWREVIGWSEDMKDPSLFRILELSIMEIT